MVEQIFNSPMKLFSMGIKHVLRKSDSGYVPNVAQIFTNSFIGLNSYGRGLEKVLKTSNVMYKKNQLCKGSSIRKKSVFSFSTCSCNKIFLKDPVIINKSILSRPYKNAMIGLSLYNKTILREIATPYILSNYFSTMNTTHANKVDDSPVSEKNVDYVRQLLNGLNVDQRRDLLLQIQLEEAEERKKEAEAKLASWHWRSKFGRPSSVYTSNVDPSGTYCEIPQDWLMKKAENSKVNPPTFSDLRQIAVFNALPFVGFGFLDNFIMIVAGDYIDLTIGIYLGISTMAAAALGNTISDLAGIGSAWYVEFLACKIGVRSPKLSQAQQDMSSTRWSANIGRGVGVCVGCILGMFPLLFISRKSKRKLKEDELHQEKEA